jgi:predicted nucleotidyltransferase
MLMAIPAEQMAERAATWAAADASVRAMIVYGSLAQGTADDDSDLDVIIVAEPGQRDALWDRREQISDLIHGHHAVWHQEPRWQRPYRYQSWNEELTELDLTLDEETANPWAALTRGFRPVVDKAQVAARLRSDLATWQPPEFDAPAFDGGTWVWLNYLRGKLRHGEAWMVRYGVMDTLANRVLPLLGTASHSAHHSLDAADIDRIHRAAPTSSEPAELRRSLRATAELYAWALEQWSERTGQSAPRSPLAPAVMDRLTPRLPVVGRVAPEVSHPGRRDRTVGRHLGQQDRHGAG